MPEAFYTLAPCGSVAGFPVPVRRKGGQTAFGMFRPVVPGSRICQSGTPVRFLHMQVYALSGYAPSYRGKWNISHSFGRKAADRYLHSGKERRYWEDRWLKGFGLSRDSLTQAMENRRGHPFGRFIYPEYEEITKRRLLSSEAGYLVCALSTLMWTPFSPSCSKCTKANPCRRRTEARYPELYRIRCEAWWKEEVKP